MHDFLVSIAYHTGIFISGSDVVASILGGIIIILLGRTPTATRFLVNAGALVFSNIRRKKISQNSMDILRGVRDQTILFHLQSEMQLRFFAILFAILSLIGVNVLELQHAMNTISPGVISEQSFYTDLCVKIRTMGKIANRGDRVRCYV